MKRVLYLAICAMVLCCLIVAGNAITAEAAGISIDRETANIAPNYLITLHATVSSGSGTVTWSSSDSNIATVSQSSATVCNVKGVRSGTVTITARLNTGESDTCTVYVAVTNGVYFICYGAGNLYLTIDSGMVEGGIATLSTKKSGGPAMLRQLWRIEHIDKHSYVIRSVFRPDMALHVTGNQVDVASISTSVTGDSVPLNRRWGIYRSSSSYMLRYVDTSYYNMKPADGAISTGTNVVTTSVTPQYCWSLEWYSDVSNQILLINTTIGLPATNAVRCVYPGASITLTDMDLMASFVSKYTIYQNIQWSSGAPSIAMVNATTGEVTGVSEGETTITANRVYNGVTHSAIYTIKVSSDFMMYGIPDGNHDHQSALETARDSINDKHTLGGVRLRANILSAQTCKSDLLTTKIFTSRSHGAAVVIPGTDQVFSTFISLDNNQEMFMSNVFADGVVGIANGDDYGNLGLALFVGCETGRGGVGGNNLPSEIVEHGAKAAIGFKESIGCSAANTWTRVFYQQLLAGDTVETAAQEASEKCCKTDPALAFDYVVITGDGTLTLANLL